MSPGQTLGHAEPWPWVTPVAWEQGSLLRCTGAPAAQLPPGAAGVLCRVGLPPGAAGSPKRPAAALARRELWLCLAVPSVPVDLGLAQL